MDITQILGPRRHYSRSGGRSSIDLSDSIQGKENRLERVRAQRRQDLETVYVEGMTPELQAYLDAPVTWRVVGQEELDTLNKRA